MTRIVMALVAAAFATPMARADVPQEFEELSILLEVNETDGDAEIVVRAKAESGLKRFWLRRPDGKKVAEVLSDDRTKASGPVGLQQIRVETGEPDAVSVLQTYHEGIYEFHGRTVDGEAVYGELALTHALLPAPTFTPADGDTVDADDTLVEWTAVAGAAFYVVEVENDDLVVNLTVTVPGDKTSFRIPSGWLLADTEYDLGVATMTADGNLSFAESSFVTAP